MLLPQMSEREILVAIYNQGVKMSADLTALKQAVADVQASAAAEATRVEEIIATLRGASVSQADIDKAVSDLEQVAANLNAVEPTPVPTTESLTTTTEPTA